MNPERRSIRLRGISSTELDRTTAERNEIFHDKTNYTLRIMDGHTPGGVLLATQNWAGKVVTDAISAIPEVDLSSYATQAYVTNTLSSYATQAYVTNTLSSYATQTYVTNTLSSYARTDTTQSFMAAQRGTVSALTDAATITPDFAVANNFSVTLGGNRTLANPSNLAAGQSGVIVITQDGTGSRTLAFGSYWKFASGTVPTLTTTAFAVNVLAYYVESSTRITACLISDVT